MIHIMTSAGSEWKLGVSCCTSCIGPALCDGRGSVVVGITGLSSKSQEEQGRFLLTR